MSINQAPSKSAQTKRKADTSATLNKDLIYKTICQVLSARQDAVNLPELEPNEWGILAQMAEAEGVAPLLYWELVRNTDEVFTAVPPRVRDFFQRSYYQTAARNAVLFSELERILAAFEKAQIAVIVLKGAALAHKLYPDRALRPMSDLDLMVRPDDLTQATQVLQALGYSQEKVTYHAYLRGGPEGQIAVEVHWCLVPDGQGRTPDIEWLWNQTQPYSAQSKHAQSLQPLAQFVYLTGHLILQTDPTRRRLIWFYDLRLLYEQHLVSADWEALFNAEATACWAAWVQAALYQLRDLLGVQLPAALIDNPVKSPRQPDTRTLTRNYIQNALAQLDRKTRLKVTLGLLFPPKSYLLLRYQIIHKWLWPLYLPRRWWEIGRYLIQTRT